MGGRSGNNGWDIIDEKGGKSSILGTNSNALLNSNLPERRRKKLN